MSAVGNYEVINYEVITDGSGPQTATLNAPSGKVFLSIGKKDNIHRGTFSPTEMYISDDGTQVIVHFNESGSDPNQPVVGYVNSIVAEMGCN